MRQHECGGYSLLFENEIERYWRDKRELTEVGEGPVEEARAVALGCLCEHCGSPTHVLPGKNYFTHIWNEVDYPQTADCAFSVPKNSGGYSGPETDVHQEIKDELERAFVAIGYDEVTQEHSFPTGVNGARKRMRRADILASRDDDKVAVEIQVSEIKNTRLHDRMMDAVRAGYAPFWLSAIWVLNPEYDSKRDAVPHSFMQKGMSRWLSMVNDNRFPKRLGDRAMCYVAAEPGEVATLIWPECTYDEEGCYVANWRELVVYTTDDPYDEWRCELGEKFERFPVKRFSFVEIPETVEAGPIRLPRGTYFSS